MNHSNVFPNLSAEIQRRQLVVLGTMINNVVVKYITPKR